MYPEEAQLHGNFINEIKQANTCSVHGHCFVDSLGEHHRLAAASLKLWAAAMVCHTSTFCPHAHTSTGSWTCRIKTPTG
jgi:hypothetical protein